MLQMLFDIDFSDYGPQEIFQRDRKLRHLVLIWFFATYFNQLGLVIFPLYLRNPQEGRYLSSYVLHPYLEKSENETSIRRAALSIGLIYETWFFTTVFGGLCLQIYINMLYLQTMTTSMKCLRWAEAII